MDYLKPFLQLLKTSVNAPYFYVEEEFWGEIIIDGRISLNELRGLLRGFYKLGYRKGLEAGKGGKR